MTVSTMVISIERRDGEYLFCREGHMKVRLETAGDIPTLHVLDNGTWRSVNHYASKLEAVQKAFWLLGVTDI